MRVDAMNLCYIKDFKYGWRFTDDNYALFTDDELSKISVISADQAGLFWDDICDKKILQESKWIKRVIDRSLPVLIGDCGWGDDDKESVTRNKLIELLENKQLTILYDSQTALSVECDLFRNKWSDFCYPSDAVIIIQDNNIIMYYEDTIYKIEKL